MTTAAQGRMLVVCCDGTNNSFNHANTNIVKLVELLKKDHPSQLVYYQAGIGTYTAPGILGKLGITLAKLADSAVAWYLSGHVCNAYDFLMQNYHAGDRICLFGFSRGAYTVRALAGMLLKVGLLPKDNREQIPFAFAMYTQPDMDHAVNFRYTFSRIVEIEFVGVWDTVSSVGSIIPKRLPFTSSNHAIRHFRHALALDEHRAKFQPNLWHRLAPNKFEAARDPELGSGYVGQSTPRLVKKELNERWPYVEAVQGPVGEAMKETDVQEVWFSGCHADVGGGSVPDSDVHALSSISLRWMLKECTKLQVGLLFDKAALRRAGLPPSTFHPSSVLQQLSIKQPKSPSPNSLEVPQPVMPSLDGLLGSELPSGVPGTSPRRSFESHTSEDHFRMTAGELDKEEALTPIHDQARRFIWWPLELMPLVYTYQDEHGNWHKTIRMNMFRGRVLRETTRPKFHVTVQYRQQSLPDYRPRMRVPKDLEPIWVE